ncbi:MAG: threonylcarbamoyl-AMP synthase [Planctomycetaceae bacterium]|nr:threonylcarbamoyl-AMP synthase [Planctomycetaceae bacterium]
MSTHVRIGTDIDYAAAVLRSGGLVAIPTETVYGLAADATNPKAVAAIFAAKNRPTFDPLIVHLADISQVREYVCAFPPAAEQLASRYWPGPITLVLPRQSVIPDLVTSGLDGVGVRVPSHPMTLQLLRTCQCPLAAPSANPFGGISPTTASHVAAGLGHVVDYILDGGPCTVGVESTVVSFMQPQAVVLRPGGLSIEAISAVIGPVERAVSDPAKDDSAQPSPGMLSRHYAPRIPMRLIERDEIAIPASGQRCGLLTWGTNCETGFDRVINVSEAGDLQSCAAGFFAALRDLDSSGLDCIIARKFPDSGLGVALNDRLRRASS